jgi:hypothetical protein
MNLNIDNGNIEGTFDRIATDLLLEKALFVNGKEIRFTEIEFYFFDPIHQDTYTHEHTRNVGEWRFHSQGLDITFQGNKTTDGGILIRGILVDNEYINGPRKVVGKIFELFGKVTESGTIILSDSSIRKEEIIKTFRHLPNKENDPNFQFRPYRYLTDLDICQIPKSIKEQIKKRSIKL